MAKFVHYYEYIRARFADELRAMPPLAREAAIFARTLEQMPVQVEQDDYIIGWFGGDKVPEDEPVASFDGPLFDTPEEEAEYVRFRDGNIICPSIDRAHTCADYETILRRGLVWYIERIDAALQETPDNDVLLAMRASVLAVKAFCERVADVVENAAAAQNPRIARMAAALRRVPFYPAETLYEALQAVWIIHFAIPMAENAWYSISLGRFDQYIYPYYRAALESGESAADVKAAFYQFFRLLNSYADGACALNLGGADAAGESMYNELSMLLLEYEKEWRFPGPIFTVRVARNTPDEVMDALVDPVLFGIGQPTFYGEENCRRALIHRGVPAEEVTGFACNSCMGIAMPGQECNNMWGCVFNTNVVLELAVNSGKTLAGDQLVPAADVPPVTDLDSLLAAFEACARPTMRRALAYYQRLSEHVERYHPDPFFSAITEDCIRARKDRLSGARYHNATVETFGMVDAADGICAIDTLVFRQKRYTLAQLCEAVTNDFADAALYRAVTDCPQYGTGNDVADAVAARVAEILCRIIDECSHDNVHFLPSLHTLDTNVAWGYNWRASFNGRRAGEPFAKNAGPQNRVRRKDCTSLLLSAGKLPQTTFTGGQPVDLHFLGKDVGSPEGKRKIAALIRTYFAMDGLQLQVNSLSADQLEEAYNNPDRNSGLIVRVGGFSVYFDHLTDPSKREFIERFRREEV